MNIGDKFTRKIWSPESEKIVEVEAIVLAIVEGWAVCRNAQGIDCVPFIQMSEQVERDLIKEEI